VAKKIAKEAVLTRVGELFGVKAMQHASEKRKEYRRIRNRASKMCLEERAGDLVHYVPQAFQMQISTFPMKNTAWKQ